MNNDRRHFLDGSTAPRKPLTEAKTLLVELQNREREQLQMKELQKLQTIARAKAKAWDTRYTNPKSEAQEAVFDAAVDKLSDAVRDAEDERRYEKVIDKDGKDIKKPSAALLKQLLPQRAAQLKRDASDYADWVGTAQFDRDSSKASIIIDEIKKGLARAKTTKKEEVTTEGIMKPVTEAKKIKYPEDLQYKNHRDMTPAEKQRWIAWNRAYNQAVQTRDFSGVETSPSLGTKSKEYQDAWKAWNRQRTMHAANRDFHLIKPFVAPKEKTKKKTKGGKKAYFMDYPNKYEEVTTEATDAARAKHNAAVLRAAGGAKAYQAQKMAKRPIMDREISEFVARLSAKQIILLKKLIAARIADAAALLGVKGSGYQDQGGNQIGNNRGGRGYQGGNQIGND
jgi:hypothetical protein